MKDAIGQEINIGDSVCRVGLSSHPSVWAVIGTSPADRVVLGRENQHVVTQVCPETLVVVTNNLLVLEGTFQVVPTATMEALCDDQFFLECLRGAGVDNWEGYDFAMEDFHAEDA